MRRETRSCPLPREAGRSSTRRREGRARISPRGGAEEPGFCEGAEEGEGAAGAGKGATMRIVRGAPRNYPDDPFLNRFQPRHRHMLCVVHPKILASETLVTSTTWSLVRVRPEGFPANATRSAGKSGTNATRSRPQARSRPTRARTGRTRTHAQPQRRRQCLQRVVVDSDRGTDLEQVLRRASPYCLCKSRARRRRPGGPRPIN